MFLLEQRRVESDCMPVAFAAPVFFRLVFVVCMSVVPRKDTNLSVFMMVMGDNHREQQEKSRGQHKTTYPVFVSCIHMRAKIELFPEQKMIIHTY
jgi:hypothetical protein